jgi:pimeloyl-ACP methyl ester carboxylesterase
MELTLSLQGASQSRGGPFQTSLGAMDRALEGSVEPPILIGHSMGALASILLAARYPIGSPDSCSPLRSFPSHVTAARRWSPQSITPAIAHCSSQAHVAPTTAAGTADIDFRARATGLAALARFGLARHTCRCSIKPTLSWTLVRWSSGRSRETVSREQDPSPVQEPRNSQRDRYSEPESPVAMVRSAPPIGGVSAAARISPIAMIALQRSCD